MKRLEALQEFVRQRLTAAVDDIFIHVERTMREYEEELLEAKLMLTAGGKRSSAASPADVQQVLVNEDAPSEDSFIKEEQEDVASSPVPVKTEDEDDEAPEDDGGPGPARAFNPEVCSQPIVGDEAETDVSEDYVKKMRRPGPDHHDDAAASGAGKKSFICSECGRRFGRKDSLRRHMRYHTGERPYSCSVCGKRFSQRPNLIRHMRCHSGEKPFSCSFCRMSFAVRSALVNHMRIHTGEKPFSCLYCEKSFTQKGGLKKHMTVHTGEKPYSCPMCEKTFSQKANLTYHFSVHTGQKQFSCSICDKRFSWQSQVKSHKCVGESNS